MHGELVCGAGIEQKAPGLFVWQYLVGQPGIAGGKPCPKRAGACRDSPAPAVADLRRHMAGLP